METNITLNDVKISTEYLDENFVEALVDFWEKLPEAVKETVADYWKNEDNHTKLDRPIFALIEKRLDGHSLAGVSLRGFLFRFWREAVNKSTPEQIKESLAHEIAHVYDYATGAISVEYGNDVIKINGEDVCSKCKPCFHELPAHDDPVQLKRDEYAEEKVLEWGFKILDA